MAKSPKSPLGLPVEDVLAGARTIPANQRLSDAEIIEQASKSVPMTLRYGARAPLNARIESYSQYGAPPNKFDLDSVKTPPVGKVEMGEPEIIQDPYGGGRTVDQIKSLSDTMKTKSVEEARKTGGHGGTATSPYDYYQFNASDRFRPYVDSIPRWNDEDWRIAHTLVRLRDQGVITVTEARLAEILDSAKGDFNAMDRSRTLRDQAATGEAIVEKAEREGIK